MPGSMLSSEGVASFGDHVEVVQGDRIRPKAIYRRRPFRLMSVDSTRYRWRCTVTNCSSRLMTDRFGDKHVLYSFKDHDEDEHRAAEDRKRSDKTFRSEVVKKIGEFLYVPERSFGDIRCWRCKYVSCSGRCRTSLDGNTVLHGPTKHTCRSSTGVEQARPPHDQPLSSQHTPAGPSQGVACTSTDSSEHQQEQHTGNAAEHAEDLSVYSPDVTLHEEHSHRPQASLTAVNANGIESDGDSRSAHVTASRATEVTGVSEAEAGQSHRLPSLFGIQKQTSGPEKPCEAATNVEEVDMIGLLDNDSDDDTLDMNERSRRSDDECEAERRLRSRLRFSGQRNMTSTSGPGNSMLALEMMSSSCTCAEPKLRVAIYQQISTVLSMEEALLREQMRNEVRRGRLLDSQMKKGPSAAE